ncbi:ribonuclease VapC [Mycolicibacterium canariasense]|uniref:Ribonuclease VapC n=1 Tax=Mycolicibacterium canariasense TaxID=228230 RepID=A0A100WFM3_MYCCR|nr:type II toxin-antitoxin system VapC family toxin [Mycolicibacterium canariasense]MCV7211539.1 type II toxin-antitoxin system VapC family toxin [Mycolicibacterium canariasense]ORV08540.1 ribonuclease [Mycolicibacterium canariasense]GAS97138.1 ribonuclease VapC [Mycolicibacterium canariasense]
MIVLDASAAIAALLNGGQARRLASEQVVNAPHLVDAEVLSTLRRQTATGALTPAQARQAIDVWARLGMNRYAAQPLLERVWELRDTVTAYDAMYVALAEALECPLLTADARLSRAPGIRCAVTVVPN